MSERLRVCLIASSRHPVAEPFAGGLEAHTHQLASELIRRGHDVTLFAGVGSDPALPVRQLPVSRFDASDAARNDVAAWPLEWMAEHHAYLGLMLDLATTGSQQYDLVHNNSLHHLPVAMAQAVDVPMLTTLHTPPVPWLESAIELSGRDSHFVAVSAATSEAWSGSVSSTVVYNGVDTTRWTLGPGGGPAIWTGRIVPEKGTHLAIAAALLAGTSIELAGPIADPEYFEREVQPMLGPSVRYLGHLSHNSLVERVGAASVAVVSPRWDEPYGLVAAEAMACGTPVAGFDRGALAELINNDGGRLARADDVVDLCRAIVEARALDRRRVRAHAEAFCSLARMTDSYETLYRTIIASRQAA